MGSPLRFRRNAHVPARHAPRVTAARALFATVAVLFAACRGPLHLRPEATRIPVHEDFTTVESGADRFGVDVYLPVEPGRHPAAIILHGSGGIHAIASSTVNRYARALSEHGVASFVVHYFDATGEWTADDSLERANYFRWVREVKEAVTWVAGRPEVQRNRISLIGHSLGAWLAVGAGAVDARVFRLVLFGAGLEPFLQDSIKRMPPALLLHGDRDDVVPLAEAEGLRDFMRRHGFTVTLRIYRGEQHTFGDSAAADALTRAARFVTATPRLRRR